MITILFVGQAYEKAMFKLNLLILPLLVLLSFSSLCHAGKTTARFIKFPPEKLYVVRGDTARFVWDYRVTNRTAEFQDFSPKWMFIISSTESKTIAGEIKAEKWKFEVVASCPERLQNPTLRVSKESVATLVIINVTRYDGGTYGCTLLLYNTTSGLQYFITSLSTLIITETPRFTAKPNATTTVVEDSDLFIECAAVGPPVPNITLVPVSSGSMISYGMGNVTLRVPKVKRNLSGKEYKCSASNNPNQVPVEARTTIEVFYPPEFTLLPVNTTVTQGDTIFLHCQAKGNPSSSILWQRNGAALKPGHDTLPNGTLLLPIANKNDTGKYICTAQNFIYRIRQTKATFVYVTIKYEPTIVRKSDNLVVNETDAVNLVCMADGHPTPSITWSKLLGPFSPPAHTSEWYKIQAINKSDAGTYTCTASNGIGKDAKAYITVTVQYKPAIDESVSNTTASSWNGNQITLRCKYSDAYPVPKWTWIKPNGSLIAKVQRSITNGSEITMITQGSSDYGNYSCQATNAAGSVEHQIYVIQLFAPGQVNVTIMNVEASSATVVWTQPVKDGGSPVTGYKLEVKGSKVIEDISDLEYTIVGLTKNTDYVVKLYAKNVVGYGDASSQTFKTKKKGPPASPVITSYNYVMATSVLLTWSKPDENGVKITSYTIYSKIIGDDSKWKQVVNINGSPLTYTVKNLEPGTTYKFMITARNAEGESKVDDSKVLTVAVPVVTTPASATLAPIEPSKGKSSGGSDTNQTIIIVGVVIAVILILITVVISVIILKKKNIFRKGKRKRATTENAAYHNDVHSDDSSGRQAAVIDLGDASATYAAVDTSKKTKNKPKEIATYAAVDKSKKKKKPGEIIYAELADFNTNYTPAENRPVKYLETDYADISQFQNQSEPEPTYANFPGRSKDYVNVLDI